MSDSGITRPLEIQTFFESFLFFESSTLSFFLESSTFFHKLAILLVTSFFPDFLLKLDSEQVSEIISLVGVGLWISEAVGVRRPNLALFKLWFEGLLSTGRGILRVFVDEAVLEPDP